jgi:hypothetical protein
MSQPGVAPEHCDGSLERSEVTMSKLLAITASLKAALMVASFAFVRGDMLAVILMSALFSLAHSVMRNR